MLLHFSSKARLAIANAGEQSPRLLQANPTFPTFIDASALHLLPLHLTASVKPFTPFGFLFFPSDEPDPPLFVTFLFFSYLEFPHKEEKIAKPYSAFNSSFIGDYDPSEPRRSCFSPSRTDATSHLGMGFLFYPLRCLTLFTAVHVSWIIHVRL